MTKSSAQHSAHNLSECEEKIGYRFGNQGLLRMALTHSSCANTHLESNERLEFLGDAALGLVVSNLLYSQFPQMQEGELSKIKSFVISRKTCQQVALRLELDRFLFTGKGIGSLPDSLIANVMEAVIGAIFLDGGYDEARVFVETNFQPEIERFFEPLIEELDLLNSGELTSSEDIISEEAVDKIVDSLDGNFKAKLQTKIHHEHPGVTPEYILLDEKGPPHCKCFKVAVKIREKQFQAAWGNSKKETEQKAASNAIRQLDGLEPLYSDGE